MLNPLWLSGNANLSEALLTLLGKCSSMVQLKQIHGLLLTSGLFQDDPFVSKILSFSALSDSGNLDYSYCVVLHLHHPRTFHWNTVIRGYSRSKNPNPCFAAFVKMLRIGVLPDHLTYPFLAKATARLLNPELGLAVHSHVLRTGFGSDRFIQNSLIHMYASCRMTFYARKVFDEISVKNLVSWNSMLDGYAKCGDINLARKMFELMPERDVVSWSSLVDGYVKCGEYEEALAVFEKMQAAGMEANEVTMVSVLCACAHLGALEQGRRIHQYIHYSGLPFTLVLQTSLIDMYAKCGTIDEALAVFHSIPSKNTDVLIWNAMIGGLASNGMVKRSIGLFGDMQVAGVAPDEITYLCLLSACAHGGLVKEAWFFFDCLGKHGMTPKIEHYACMVDVLARAGQVTEAYWFINQMPMVPTSSMLGALLSGCMKHGRLDLAEIVGRKLVELDPDHDGRYIGLSNVYAAVKRWDEARSMREAMEERGIRKAPGFSFVEISGTLHRFMAHDKTHSFSEQIYATLSFMVSQMKQDVNYECQEHFAYDMKYG